MQIERREAIATNGWRLLVGEVYGVTEEDPPVRRACCGCGAEYVNRLSCATCGSWAMTTVLEAAPKPTPEERIMEDIDNATGADPVKLGAA